MTLSDYLETHDLNAAAFAKKIGVTTATIWRYARGHRIPRKAVMARIVEATGGAVQPQDFYENASEA